MKKRRRIVLALLAIAVVLVLVDVGVRVIQAKRSDDHADLRFADEARAQFTYRNVLETPETLPTRSERRKEWLPFGALSLDEFPRPPQGKTPAQGVVRVVFLGEGPMASGATQLVEQKLASKWGAGKIDIVNLGMPNATSATSLYLLRKFYHEINAHIVVIQHGYDDFLFYHGRALGAKLVFGSPEPRINPNASAIGIPRHAGLWGLFEKRTSKTLDDIPHWFRNSPITEGMSNHWQIARFAWSAGFSLLVATYPHPAENQQSSFAAQFQQEAPLLGNIAAYHSMISTYNATLSELGKTAAIEVIPSTNGDLDKSDSFLSVSVLSEKGKERWAEVIVASLAPRIESWINKGAPPPTSASSNAQPGRKIEKIDASTLPTSHPRTNVCLGDLCPPGACFIPAGKAIYGYENDILGKHIELVREATGLGSPIWDEDDGPAVEIDLSAFCIDRTEASEYERKLCIDAKACPPYAINLSNDLLAKTPAIMPAPTDAEAYCAFRGGRLPTDAEWEAAARASDARIFPWGNGFTGKEANFCGSECAYGLKTALSDNVEKVALIEQFDTKNPYGLVDVAGNLWEWTLDCFSSSIHHDIPKGTKNPLAAPEKGCRRFLRGGGFQSYAVFLEKRNAEGLPDVDVPTRGVRCVYDFGTVFTSISRRREVPSQ